MAIEVHGGGSVRVARAELERVHGQLLVVHRLLAEALNPIALLAGGLAARPLTVGLATHSAAALHGASLLPGLQARVAGLQLACLQAATQYFGVEGAVAQTIATVAPVGIPQLAGGLARAGTAAGMFVEGPVRVSRTGYMAGARPPTTLGELAERLRRTAADATTGDSAEFRIERFGNQVVAYLPGTMAWSPVAGSNPLDLTSNLYAVAADKRQIAGSERAVQTALAKAGVGAGDSVLLVGHSQGGIVAANLAATPQPYKVAGIVTFGAPIANVRVPPGTNVLCVEHRGDPVPALDAGPNPQRENWVTVKAAHRQRQGEGPLAVHGMDAYSETAASIESSRAVRLRGVMGFLRGFARGEGRIEWFTAHRL